MKNFDLAPLSARPLAAPAAFLRPVSDLIAVLPDASSRTA